MEWYMMFASKMVIAFLNLDYRYIIFDIKTLRKERDLLYEGWFRL